MLRPLLSSFGFFLVSAGALLAQPASPTGTDNWAKGEVASPASQCPRIWGSLDVLSWWTKSAHVVPLVTTNPDPNSIASLAEPGTTVLYGGPRNDINFGRIWGMRGTIGAWLTDSFGIETSFFGLPTQGQTFTAAAAGGNGPVIAVPINSTVTNIPFGGIPLGETSVNPGNLPSLIRVNSTTEMWGMEALGLFKLPCFSHGTLALVGGFQYLQLSESVAIDQAFFDTAGAKGTLSIHDGFSSRNQFYGAAIGLRGRYTCGILGAELTGTVAGGPNHEQYTVAGSTTVAGPAFGQPAGTTPGGIFALPSNSGTFSRNEFIVVPQGHVKLTIAVLQNLSLFANYDVLYMSSVVRASYQIDRNINPTQNSVFQPAVGVPAPGPNFNRTDFWGQGVSVGFQIRF